jgi:7,8-dihydroneopterin aldolase/epimerase/oxygenase
MAGHKDEVAIEGLKVRTFLGCKKWEKMTKQDVIIDLRLWTDLTNPGLSDKLDDTNNIYYVSEFVSRYVSASSHNLSENLAFAILRLLLGKFEFEEAEVTVKKPCQFKDADHSLVRIRRTQDTLAKLV